MGTDGTAHFFYNPCRNWFECVDGMVVESIYLHVTPNDVFIFKRGLEPMTFRHRSRKGGRVELYYPGPGDCEYCRSFMEGGCPGFLEDMEGCDFMS